MAIRVAVGVGVADGGIVVGVAVGVALAGDVAGIEPGVLEGLSVASGGVAASDGEGLGRWVGGAGAASCGQMISVEAATISTSATMPRTRNSRGLEVAHPGMLCRAR
jgi:hypothetical protein